MIYFPFLQFLSQVSNQKIGDVLAKKNSQSLLDYIASLMSEQEINNIYHFLEKNKNSFNDDHYQNQMEFYESQRIHFDNVQFDFQVSLSEYQENWNYRWQEDRFIQMLKDNDFVTDEGKFFSDSSKEIKEQFYQQILKDLLSESFRLIAGVQNQLFRLEDKLVDLWQKQILDPVDLLKFHLFQSLRYSQYEKMKFFRISLMDFMKSVVIDSLPNWKKGFASENDLCSFLGSAWNSFKQEGSHSFLGFLYFMSSMIDMYVSLLVCLFKQKWSLILSSKKRNLLIHTGEDFKKTIFFLEQYEKVFSTYQWNYFCGQIQSLKKDIKVNEIKKLEDEINQVAQDKMNSLFSSQDMDYTGQLKEFSNDVGPYHTKYNLLQTLQYLKESDEDWLQEFWYQWNNFQQFDFVLSAIK